MNSMNLRFLLWCVFTLATAASCAAEPWKGQDIMPRSVDIVLRVGGEAPPPPPGRPPTATCGDYLGGVCDIQWPATVKRQEGQWLWIEDNSGYSVPAVSCWVNTEDVLHLEEPIKPDDPTKLHDCYTYYTEQIQRCDAPWLHWLLGIYLKNKNEDDAARKEYDKSLKGTCCPFDPENIVGVLQTATPAKKAMLAMSACFAEKVLQDAANRVGARSGAWDQTSKDEVRRMMTRLSHYYPNYHATIDHSIAEIMGGSGHAIGDTLVKFLASPENKSLRGDIATDAAPLFRGTALENLALAMASGPRVPRWQLNAKIRRERLRVGEELLDSEFAAIQLLSVIVLGEKRPYAYYEVAEALAAAYQKQSNCDRKVIVGIENALDALGAFAGDRNLEPLKGNLKRLRNSSDEAAVASAIADAREDVRNINADLERVENALKDNLEGLPNQDVVKIVLDVAREDVRNINADLERVEKGIKDNPGLLQHLPQNPDLAEWLADMDMKTTDIGVRSTDARTILKTDWAQVLEPALRKRAERENHLKEFWATDDGPAPDRHVAPDVFVVDDEEYLLQRADAFYKLAVTQDNNGIPVGGDPSWYSGYFGRGELRSVRFRDLEDDLRLLQPESRRASDPSRRGRAQLNTSDGLLEQWPDLLIMAAELKAKERHQPLSEPDVWAKGLQELAEAICTKAIDFFSDTIRCNQGSAEAYRDRSVMYLCQAIFDKSRLPGLNAARRNLDDTISYLKKDKPEADAATPKQGSSDAVTQITDAYIKLAFAPRRNQPAPVQHAPNLNDLKKVLKDVQAFQKGALVQTAKDKNIAEQRAKRAKEATSRLHDSQLMLSNDSDLYNATVDAIQACKLGHYDDFNSVGSLTRLALVYANLGDYRSAEYYQNRAAYYALYYPDQHYEAKIPTLIDKREGYRDKILPDDLNHPWRDAPIKLEKSLPPTVSGKGGAGASSPSK